VLGFHALYLNVVVCQQFCGRERKKTVEKVVDSWLRDEMDGKRRNTIR
jgi:hypothetical protein